MARTCAKDLHNLLRHLGKLSGGQASICDWDPDDCSTFQLEIAPSGGLYASGKFKFTVGTYISILVSLAEVLLYFLICNTVLS